MDSRLGVVAVGLLLALLLGGAASSHNPGGGYRLESQVSQGTSGGLPRWYAGVVTTQNAVATEVGARFYVPSGSPSLSDTYSPLLLSVFDSNSSYDQIGISANVGHWGTATSHSHYNGTQAVYDSSWGEALLSPGSYWFKMSISDGLVEYRVLNGSGTGVIWSDEARTGGDYFLIGGTYWSDYSSTAYAGFTLYEEMISIQGVAPAFNFYSPESYFISNDMVVQAHWSVYIGGSAPPSVAVTVSGSSAYIKNVDQELTISTDGLERYTEEPITLQASSSGLAGDVAYHWRLDGAAVTRASGPSLTLRFYSPSDHDVYAVSDDAIGSVTSNHVSLTISRITLSIDSQYGNVEGEGTYDWGDLANVSLTPTALPVGPGDRIAFFSWASSPAGYVGTSSRFSLRLTCTVTETAVWKEQYEVSLLSDPSSFSSSAWYDAGNATIDLPPFWSFTNQSRYNLVGYSLDGHPSVTDRTGQQTLIQLPLTEPVTIILRGVLQYRIIVDGYDGPVLTNSPTGDLWFDEGSQANVTMPAEYVQDFTKLVFLGWGNGEQSDTLLVVPSWR